MAIECNGELYITVTLWNGDEIRYSTFYGWGIGGYLWDGSDFKAALEKMEKPQDLDTVIRENASEYGIFDCDERYHKFIERVNELESKEQIVSVEVREEYTPENGRLKVFSRCVTYPVANNFFRKKTFFIFCAGKSNREKNAVKAAGGTIAKALSDSVDYLLYDNVHKSETAAIIAQAQELNRGGAHIDVINYDRFYLLLCAEASDAYTVRDKFGNVYLIQNDGTLLDCAFGAETATIPDCITAYGEHSVCLKDIRRLTIPGTVKTIPTGAFGCFPLLQYVVLEEGIEQLEDSSFGPVGPISVRATFVMPKSLTSIADEFFWRNVKTSMFCVPEGSYAKEWAKKRPVPASFHIISMTPPKRYCGASRKRKKTTDFLTLLNAPLKRWCLTHTRAEKAQTFTMTAK